MSVGWIFLFYLLEEFIKYWLLLKSNDSSWYFIYLGPQQCNAVPSAHSYWLTCCVASYFLSPANKKWRCQREQVMNKSA